MNTSRFTCSRERSVHDATHATLRVADVLFTSPLFRLFGVCGASKIRPFLSFKRGPLFFLGFFGGNKSNSRLPKFGFSFFSPFVSTHAGHKVRMAISQMLSLRNTLKVFQPIISLNAVNVVDLFGGVKAVQPTFSNCTVNERFAHDQITAGVRSGRIGAMLSDNFPAARDGVKVIKGAVFHAIYCKANHAVSSVITNMITLSAFRRNVQ